MALSASCHCVRAKLEEPYAEPHARKSGLGLRGVEPDCAVVLGRLIESSLRFVERIRRGQGDRKPDEGLGK